MTNPDLIIVGAGLFGMTIAQQAAENGFRVQIIDKRRHIGGNAYSYFDQETGIEIHRYGAHIFHTSNERVWDYANRFTRFTNYVHRVRTIHNGEVFPLPVNLGTINQFFRAAYTPDEARALIEKQAAEYAGIVPSNLGQQGVKLIGRPLYEAFFKNYTAKQWQTNPALLPASIIRRLPVRFNYDDRYFRSAHEGMPADGYTPWFERMIDSPRIDVALNTDFFAAGQPFSKAKVRGNIPVVYSGPIDTYFDYCEGRLGWRTVDFTETRYNETDHLGCAVMNYADLDVPYTRSIEFKNFNPEREQIHDQKRTVVWSESSRFADSSKGDEPYYPINTAQDTAMFAKYRALEADEPMTVFGGRLGNYAYFDMDQTINAALITWEKQVRPLLK